MVGQGPTTTASQPELTQYGNDHIREMVEKGSLAQGPIITISIACLEHKGKENTFSKSPIVVVKKSCMSNPHVNPHGLP